MLWPVGLSKTALVIWYFFLDLGLRSPGDQAFFQELQSQGCQPIAIAESVTNMDDVMRAVTASPLPITGLIHLGMVLKVSERIAFFIA